MKIFRFFLLTAFLSAAASSCSVTELVGTVDAPDGYGPLVVKTIEGGSLSTVDTLRLSGGSFTFRPDLTEGQPEFFYIYKDDVKLASLILSRGDRVSIKCDTLGYWSVEGSLPCEKLIEAEKECFADASSGAVTMRAFIEHRRSLTRYVMGNSHSLAVVPVLFSQFGGIAVFSQPTDAVMFNAIADSLETVYPQSRYIRMLRSEAQSRLTQMKMQAMLDSAYVTAYPELSLPDISGKEVSLTQSARKATLLVFWDPSDATHKIYNLDTLSPLWEQYQAAGLQIYQVALGQDKGVWALAVREQKLPWINVSDTRGISMQRYAVMQVPAFYILTEDGMTPVADCTLQNLSKVVSAALKK